MNNRATKSIRRILANEGGYVNNPKDKGGPTNLGITLLTFRRFIKPNGTIADLKQLTEAQAVVVYKRQYWDVVMADLLPVGVGYVVADFAVNSGPKRAVKYLQAVLNVPVDGLAGPKTIEAAQKMSVALIIHQLCDDRMAFLKRLRSWETFGRGWSIRVAGVRAAALADSRAAFKEAAAVVVVAASAAKPKPKVDKTILTAAVAAAVAVGVAVSDWFCGLPLISTMCGG